MTQEQASYIIKLLTEKGILFERGLNNDEVLKVESKFNVNFPPDLKFFLQTALPVSEGFVNWRVGLTSDEEAIKIISRFDWPLEGMLFDLHWNGFWLKSWGDRPITLGEKEKIVKEKYLAFPKLIPIYAHRYIPSQPNEEGNPVFSVYQMDIIYYGYDLSTYFSNEFYFELSNDFELLDKPKREIEFWSKWVEEWSYN